MVFKEIRIRGWLWLGVSLTLLLSACGDSPASNAKQSPTNTATALDGTTLSLQLTDTIDNLTTTSISSAKTGRVTATVRDPGNNPIQGLVVSFATQEGSFNPTSGQALTDANGKASVELLPGPEIGAGNVFATIGLTDENLTATIGYNIIPANLNSANAEVGSIEFISAIPNSIALKGTGGAGLSEFSIVTFRVRSVEGLALYNRSVTFTLNTQLGGIALSSASAVTDANGLVRTTVQAGTIPSSVRVTATASFTDSTGTPKTIVSQSDQLSISTGIPDQNSFSLGFSTLNPEAADLLGTQVTVTARLADHYNNFVPDGTTVYFTAEGGSIEPSCQTQRGGCSVTWISQSPYPSDHRVTILATAIGNESFTDTNSDGQYTDVDGEPYRDANANNQYDEPFLDANSNGVFDEPYVDGNANNRYDPGETFTDHNRNGLFDGNSIVTGGADNVLGETTFTDRNGNGRYDGSGTLAAGENYTDHNSNGIFDGFGFSDMGEPFLDSNENGLRNPDEAYIDSNNSGSFDSNGDGAYNGILCVTGNNCSAQSTIHVRASNVLVTASSNLYLTANNANATTIYSSNRPGMTSISNTLASANASTIFSVSITDTAGQVPPEGTVITVNSSIGSLSGPTHVRVGQSNDRGGLKLNFTITDNDGVGNATGVIDISAVTPSGQESSIFVPLSL